MKRAVRRIELLVIHVFLVPFSTAVLVSCDAMGIAAKADGDLCDNCASRAFRVRVAAPAAGNVGDSLMNGKYTKYPELLAGQTVSLLRKQKEGRL